MAFQTRNLWMLSLGLEGDSPPNNLQPPLPDGMHLRWAFEPARGFPWYGYYLFRRPASKGDPLCFNRLWSKDEAGVATDRIGLNFGELTSDEPFTFTEDFPPAGIFEIDLGNREYVRYRTPPNEPIRLAQATIGFRAGEQGQGGTRECADFRRDKEQPVENPLNRQQAEFTAYDEPGRPRRRGRVVAMGGMVGWHAGRRAEIKLPCAARRVEIVVAHFNKSRPPKLAALDSEGNVLDQTAAGEPGVQSFVLEGKNIAAVQIDAPENETIVLRVCWVCEDDRPNRRPPRTRIRVTARWQGLVVVSRQVTGAAGTVRQVQLSADAIDEIEISSGNAALIDLCVVPVRQGVTSGWDRLAEFDYPLCLPSEHADYPCPGKPATRVSARNRALNRITYGPSGPWGGVRFDAIHDRLDRLLENGPPPGGEEMIDRFEPIAGSPAPPPETGGSITQQRQRPLELMLLGSLHPPLAQMLGLYWYDKSAVPGQAYDYLLIADHDGSLGGTADTALTWINTVFDFSVVDGVVIFNKVVAPAVPLPAPDDARAFALPGSTVISTAGAVLDATNNAGLTWNRRQIGAALQADAPVMHHVWRADLGNVNLPSVPGPGDFTAITERSPVPVGRAILSPPETPPALDDWPPFSLHYIDRGRPDGWYAYQISGIDIFGRHSGPSDPAVWHQWAPRPNPTPWYYVEPAADRVIHPSAIRLLDKLAPPSPPGVEAFALDPADPNVLHDAAWQTWFDSLTAAEKQNVIGLRVRWHWTLAQQQQAPDTREFRVYYEPAPANTLRGRVTAIATASATETDVVTDIANAQPANSFAGLSIRIGVDSFVIVSSLAGTPLRLRVRNIGPTDNVRPNARTRCAVPLIETHPLFTDFSFAAEWQDRLLVVPYADFVTVDVHGNRRYEVFMPVPAAPNRAGLPLVTTLEEPISAALIGVTASDDKRHTPDHRGDPDRYGNESRIGGPATVFRVRRERPGAPALPPDSEKLYASPADYHGHSYFTYRWLKAPLLKMFPYRALDDAVFQADLARRPRDPLLADQLQFFPSEAVEARWDVGKRGQVAADLNALNGLDKTQTEVVRAAYRGLSNDALRVLAGLPGTERVFVQLTPQPIDPEEPDATAPGGLRWRRVGPDVAPGSLGADERAYVDTLDGRATNRYFYRYAYVDEAYNIGDLSLSSPPVWLPDVTPPVAPRIARVAAGDRQITVDWISNREPDLAEYQIFRTFEVNRARDVRLMDLVHTEAVAAGDPAARPAILSWTDNPVPGLRDVWYRIVAVDRVSPDPQGGGGNVSSPSPAIRSRAYDLTPPDPPPITTLEWVRVDEAGTIHAWADPVPPGEEWLPSVRLEWPAAANDVKLLVQVKAASDDDFRPASAWLAPNTTSYLHRTTRTFEDHEYRLKATSGAGNLNVVFHPAMLAAI